MEDKEINQKFKACKTAEELKTVAKEIGYELTNEEADAYFKQFSASGELSDDELINVSGGGCTKWRNGKAYSGNPDYWLITTIGNSCSLYMEDRNASGIKGTCCKCAHGEGHVLVSWHCQRRKYYDDPLNP